MIRWFEFRNEEGKRPAPISLKDVELIHNYALKYLAESKYSVQPAVAFWNSAPPLGAIKPKFESYLKGIEHRTKLLKETPRKEAKSGDIQITVKGFFKEYQPAKSFQAQRKSDIAVELIMDEGTCGMYEEISREMAEKIDDHSKENIEALVSLAVMELQYFRGCDVDWKKKDGASAVSSGEEDDDNDDEFDFTSIDCTDVLSDETLKDLRYAYADKFMKRRESFALAMLMFLSEDLSCKLAELSGQVHAGWKKAFGKPVDIEQLISPPHEILDIDFTEKEQDWLSSTLRHFVSEMTLEQREDLGIGEDHLEKMGITVGDSDAAEAGKVQPLH